MTDRAGAYLIVGSGIAGLAAAETLRAIEPRAAITMISEEPHDFYSRPGLAYLLRGDIPEKQLFIRGRDDHRILNIKRINARVEQVHCDEHEVVLANGKRLSYDRLLLATGALANAAPFPGGDLAGVVKLDSLDDARTILKLAGRGRPAVVVGGGITALELVEGLLARGMTVHYFMRGDRYWSDVLDESESKLILERLALEGVVIHKQTQVARALGARGKLTAVETQSGETVPCQVLAVAIGVKPRIDLARQAGLKVERGVIVDEFLQASKPDVFAAGDVTEVHDSRGGRFALDVLWSTALAQGHIAGANMAGGRHTYVKSVPFNVTCLAGLKVTIIGAVGSGKDADLLTIARGDSESWRRLPRAWILTDQDDVDRIRLVVGERTIAGALVMGDQTWSRPLQRLITEQVDISSIRSVLTTRGSAALRRLADFYHHWETGQAR
jgi:nitrite reductase (NADH) large subunit